MKAARLREAFRQCPSLQRELYRYAHAELSFPRQSAPHVMPMQDDFDVDNRKDCALGDAANRGPHILERPDDVRLYRCVRTQCNSPPTGGVTRFLWASR